MKPTVGRIVHYHNASEKQQGRPYAALVTAVEGERITLSVTTPAGGRFNAELPIEPNQDENEWWAWPPRD